MFILFNTMQNRLWNIFEKQTSNQKIMFKRASKLKFIKMYCFLNTACKVKTKIYNANRS